MAAERTALLLGATGLVGGALLGRLLADPGWTVTVLGRRTVGIRHPRLREELVPLDRLAEHAARFRVDAVFCALGTTIRAAGSREAFRRVDLHGIAEAARLAAGAGAARFILVSSAGADPRSRLFYSRVKGEAERAVADAGLPAVAILRPSLLLGSRSESRPLEAIAQRAARWLAPAMRGPLRRLRPVRAMTVAGAMQRLASLSWHGVRIVENDEIFGLDHGGSGA